MRGIDEHVWIQVPKPKETAGKEGKIALPQGSSLATHHHGEVLYVGNGVKDVQIGEIVLFENEALRDVELGDQMLVVVIEAMILGAMSPSEAEEFGLSLEGLPCEAHLHGTPIS